MMLPLDAYQRLIVFYVGQRSYAIPIEFVKEITPMAELSNPPGAPHLLSGILNLEGEAVPVVCLARLFGAEEQPVGAYTPLLILRTRPRHIALQVERVQQIISVDATDVVSMPAGHSFNDCACGVVSRGGGFIVVLSPERLLLEQERAFLDDLESQQQGRVVPLQEMTP